MSAPPDGRDVRAARRARWIARLGVPLLRALAATWRIRVTNREAADIVRAAGRPVVFAFWHGELLPLLWQHRDEGVAMLVSSHRDGEIVARVGEALGFRLIRGSSSRGGGRALLGLVRALGQGLDVAVAPDGPRGPARAFAPGALIAAHRASAPVILVAAHASRAWRLRSWDRFLIPKMFARVTVSYSEPIAVETASAREAGDEAVRFEALLAEVAARARG